MATPMAEDNIEDDQLGSMTTDDIVRKSRLLDGEIRIFKDELQRLSMEIDSLKDKTKENEEKIKLNKQLPYLVGNIVEESPRTMVGFATFDSTIHFYNLKRILQQRLMLIVPDVQDVYTPLQTDVIVQLAECRQHLEQLLESIPTMFQSNKVAESAFGAATKAAFLAMKSTGGKLLVFQSVLPSIGLGALSARESEGRTTWGYQRNIVLRFPSNLGTIIYGCFQIPVGAIGVLLMDRAGRRPLLLVSASGLVVGSLLVGTSFFMKANELSLECAPALALIGIMTFVGSFGVGMGAVPWVIMAEILPINIKGTAGSLIALVNWFASWMITLSFNFLMSWSSYEKTAPGSPTPLNLPSTRFFELPPQ